MKFRPPHAFFVSFCLLLTPFTHAAQESAEQSSELTATQNVSADQAELEQQAKQKIKQFAQTLKGTLKAAIKQGGLAQGVTVCNEQAPQIADALSVDGWTLARTSLKTRNVNNQPDEWEKDTLLAFESSKDSGVPFPELHNSKLDDNQFRFMKAIPTGQICLACHGKSIDEQLSNTIKELYPTDMARGFELHDIRGAFTVSKKL